MEIKAREEAKLSQRDLSEKTGIKPSQMFQIGLQMQVLAKLLYGLQMLIVENF
mgnify:CR=1 FL=1